MKLSHSQIALIALSILSIALIIVITFKNDKIAELTLENAKFDERFDSLQAEINSYGHQVTELEISVYERDVRIKEMIEDYEEQPTDYEVIYTTNTKLLSPNAHWDSILQATEIADDSAFFQP